MDGKLGIVMELGECNLAQLLARDHPSGMPLPQALPLLIQVAEALGDLHRRGATHLRLKPENILVSRRDEGGVLVADYGLSVLGRSTTPESLPGPADVWSLGRVALFLLGCHLDPLEISGGALVEDISVSKAGPAARSVDLGRPTHI